MTKSTRDVSMFKSFPEAFISPLFFKNSFTVGGGIILNKICVFIIFKFVRTAAGLAFIRSERL